jgi:hypothetical protein
MDWSLGRKSRAAPAIHEMPAVDTRWVPCYCCGTSIQADNLVRFAQHPEDGVCVGCATGLQTQSLPVIDKIHPPIWKRLHSRRSRAT